GLHTRQAVIHRRQAGVSVRIRNRTKRRLNDSLIVRNLTRHIVRILSRREHRRRLLLGSREPVLLHLLPRIRIRNRAEWRLNHCRWICIDRRLRRRKRRVVVHENRFLLWLRRRRSRCSWSGA